MTGRDPSQIWPLFVLLFSDWIYVRITLSPCSCTGGGLASGQRLLDRLSVVASCAAKRVIGIHVRPASLACARARASVVFGGSLEREEGKARVRIVICLTDCAA